MDNKKLKISKYIAIFSVLTFFLVLGGSYATVVWTTRNYNIALDSSCFDINYIKGQNINTTIGTTDESVYIQDARITMHSTMAFTTVSIELDEDCYDMFGLATIKANITSLSNDFKSGGNAYNKLRYVVVEYDPSDYNNLTMSELEGDTFDILNMGYINNTGTINVHTEFMDPGDKKDYIVVFYIAELDRVASGTFAASIDAEVVQTDESSRPVYTPIEDFTYYIDSYNNNTLPEGKVLLTKYNGTNTVVNIPTTYTIDGNEYSVIIESRHCFYQNSNITEVNFPDNILFYSYSDSTLTRNSAYYLFYVCTNLVNVNSIGYFVVDMDYTFSSCTSLVNAPEIPNSVTRMYYTFSHCTSLVNAPTIPNSVINIHGAFYNCVSLVNAPTIGSSVQNMCCAFYQCTSLVIAPIIPGSVTDMSYTFDTCTSLVTAPVIPSSVTDMTRTFYGCSNLTGTIRINSSSVTRTSGASYHPFYGNGQNITVEVPEGSTTYTTINTNKPTRVTISTY